MKRREAPLVKVPLVIPRKQTFATLARERIILPTLMLILPAKPPGGTFSALRQFLFAFHFAKA
jgi:hypothetical protein